MIFAVVSLVILIIPYQGILNCYGFQDDYLMLVRADSIRLQQWHESTGRPLFGSLVRALWPYARSVCDLTAFRIAAFFGIYLIGIMLYWTFRHAGWPISVGGATSLLIVLSPPFGIYTAWASTFNIPFSIIFAIGSAHVLLNNFPENTGNIAVRRSARTAISTILLFCAASLYQSSMPFFLLYVVIVLFFSHRKIDLRAPELYYALGVFLITNIGYLVLFKLTIWPFELSGEVEKSGFVEDYGEKALWFLRVLWDYALPLHGTLLYPYRFNWVGLITGVLIGAGLVAYLRRHERPKTMALLVVASVPMAFYPSLLTQDPYISYRTQACLAALFVIFIMLGLVYVRNRYTRVISSVLLLCLGASLAYYNVTEGLVRPNEKEYGALEPEIRRFFDAGNTEYSFIMPDFSYSPFGYIEGEYGLLGTHHDWAPGPMARLIAREYPNIEDSMVKVTPVRDPERSSLPPDTRLMDGVKIIRSNY